MSCSYYLINMGGGDIVQCPGDQATAEKHLRQLRNWYSTTYKATHGGRRPEAVPWLIGVYPPESVGGPEGKGGVYSYGYAPNWLGSIDTNPADWQRVSAVSGTDRAEQ
jgi:hypothetical protein